MGFGLLKLVSVGKENEILNVNPQITFFKKQYNNINNFSIETIPQYFKSVPNFGRRITANISKIGELINDMSLFIELQEIPPCNHISLPTGIKKFAWVKKIGLAMIKYIDVEIDGILIERHYNDWLNIYNEIELYDNTHLEQVLGNIELLTDYSNGKESYKLYIPLRFFFNIENYLALPICALYKQDVKIHLELNNFEKCYKESPTHYFTIDENICLFQKDEIIEQQFDNNRLIGKFIYFDLVNKRVYYEKIFNTFLIPSESNKNNTKYNIIGKTSNFKIIPKYNTIIIKDESYFNNIPPLKDAHLLVNYVFLGNEEKMYFQNAKHQYIIPMVQNILDKDITSINNNYKLTLTSPHRVLFWRCVMNSNIDINDIFNYTTLPLTEHPEKLINTVRLIVNSIPRIDINNNEFYTHLQTYINNYKSNNVFMLSLCENPKENYPGGTLNFSKVDDAYLQLNLNNKVSFQNPFNIRLYGLYYNILVIENGTSSLKFVN